MENRGFMIADLMRKKLEITKSLKEVTVSQNDLLKQDTFEEIAEAFEKSMTLKSKIISDIGAIDHLIDKQKESIIDNKEGAFEFKYVSENIELVRRIESKLSEIFEIEELNKQLIKNLVLRNQEENQKIKENQKMTKQYTTNSKNNYQEQAFFFDQKS